MTIISDVIGLAGFRGAGKDEVAKALIREGFVNIKMAGALKHMIDSYLEYIGLEDPKVRLEYIEGSKKETESELFSGKTSRWGMQSLGTEWGRNCMGEDFWTNAFRTKASQHALVVCTDVRFHNEVDLIHDLGGVVYRIERPSITLDAFSLHPSEAFIPHLKVDGIIYNGGTLDDLQVEVERKLGVTPRD